MDDIDRQQCQDIACHLGGHQRRAVTCRRLAAMSTGALSAANHCRNSAPLSGAVRREAMSDRLAQIEGRLDAATPGPWRWGEDGYREPVLWRRGWSTRVLDNGSCERDTDAELIANAPTDLRYLLDEVKRLRSALGPNYHVADIREDGWSIQHPIRCRDSMLDCDLHRVATHDWQEPPAPVGRYRATLTASAGIALTNLEGGA